MLLLLQLPVMRMLLAADGVGVSWAADAATIGVADNAASANQPTQAYALHLIAIVQTKHQF